MKKLITFFSGIVLIALTIAMLFLTSAIYDAAQKTSVDTYFFQTNLRSEMRPGAPISASELSKTAMREMLIKKYVTEYFYAIPDSENIARRMMPEATLEWLSTQNIFKEWQNGEAVKIQSLVKDKKMRIVDIDDEIFKPSGSDYWVVPYVLYTWDTANDMNSAPTMTRGKLLMGIVYQPGVRSAIDITDHLKHSYNRFQSGYRYDPADIFRFRVTYLEQKSDD